MNPMNCDVCGNEICDDERNYQATDECVVCESCCRRLIDRARESRVKSAALRTDQAAEVEIDGWYTEHGGGD